MSTVKDNEAVYDERIAPLVAKIIDVCVMHGIPMFATFEYAPGEMVTTAIPVLGGSDAIAKCARAVVPASVAREHGGGA